VLTWVVAVSTARRAPVTLFGFDQMNATWVLYLAVSGASGRAFSLDRLLARRRHATGGRRPGGSDEEGRPKETVSANLGLRLIQLHLAVVYGSAGLSKLMAPEWWNGSALGLILLTPEFRRLDPTWFLAHPSLLQVLTHAAVAFEICYPVLIWVRPLRPLLLAAVILMHVGIDQMLGLTEFGLSMMAANLAFLPVRVGVPSAVGVRSSPSGRSPGARSSHAESPGSVPLIPGEDEESRHAGGEAARRESAGRGLAPGGRRRSRSARR
jgi:hypothetical protein